VWFEEVVEAKVVVSGLLSKFFLGSLIVYLVSVHTMSHVDETIRNE